MQYFLHCEINLEIVKFFIENGANMNTISSFGENAFTTACRKCENIETIKYLIQNGANIDSMCMNNRSLITMSLINCCNDYDCDVIKLLVENGADVYNVEIVT